MTPLSRLVTWLRRARLPSAIFAITAVLTLPVSAQPLSQGTGGAETESPAACSQAQYGLADISQQGEEDEIYFGFPPNPDGPTLVGVGLFIDEISDIDELDESFSVEAYMELIWCDPREAFDESEIGMTQKIFVRNDAAAKLDQVWWPTIAIVNEVGGREIKNQELIISTDGTVHYREKFSQSIENHFELTRFPFDSQELEIEIESFAWDASFVVFHVEGDRTGISDEVTPAAWRVESIAADVESAQEVREQTAFSEYNRHWEKDFHLRKLKFSAYTLVRQITVGILLKIFILKAKDDNRCDPGCWFLRVEGVDASARIGLDLVGRLLDQCG